MQIKILYDNRALSPEFSSGWGFSCLIDEKILFDTGEEGKSLLRNMAKMNIDISKLQAVVISHDHWDHRGGLWEVLKKNRELTVYTCPDFSQAFHDKAKLHGSRLIKLNKFTSIDDNIYSTGEIEGEYSGGYMPEQSLVLKTSKGITILTGCAHPGIIEIIEKVKESIPGNIYLVLGGFHLMNEDKKKVLSIVNEFKQLGVENVAPSHCSGKKAANEFRKVYKDNFVELKVGQNLDV